MNKVVKREKDEVSKNNSLKKVFVFISTVFLLLVISVVVKLFYIVKDSKYNGRDQFSISVIANPYKASIISFNPQDKSISHVILIGERKNLPPGRLLGVFTDSNIYLGNDLKTYSVSKILFNALIRPNNKTQNITHIDILRLFIFANSLPVSGYLEDTLNLKLASDTINGIAQKHFTDEDIIRERKSIEIVNGTGISGLGQRLERVLQNTGCNVVAVNASLKNIDKSEIIASEKDSYTFEKLQKNLKYPDKTSEKPEIADIKIIIGIDGVRDSVF